MGAAFARDAPTTLQTIVSALLRTKLELAIAGLDGSGKSTLANVLRDPLLAPEGANSTVPTIGLVVTRTKQRGIDVMLWDLGGHERFREDWARHVRGCGALIFVVDCADPDRFVEARQALQRLLEDPVIGRMPLLVLANKIDLLAPADRACEEVRGWATLARELSLMDVDDDAEGFDDHTASGSTSRRRRGRRVHYGGGGGVTGGGGSAGGRWSILGVSASRGTNLAQLLRWLVLQAHSVGEEPSGGELAEGTDAAGGAGASGRLGRLWQSLWGSKVGRRSSRWRGFSLLSDASRSLLVEAS
jgi:small GTP-binding protein